MTGVALYGERWQSPIARDLGVSARTVRHWCAGKHDCPADTPARLLPLVRARGDVLEEVATVLELSVGGNT